MPGEARGVASARVDPLTQARQDREALERFQQTQSGPPAELFGIEGALGSRRDIVSAQRANAAERHRRRGTQLLEAGRLAAAIDRWRHYGTWLGELRQLLSEAERGQPLLGRGQSSEPTA